MTMPEKTTVRTERVSATREAILAAAERLFAEHGVLAVSNRQVSEAAGQGNNAAVGYHFGTKADLVRAIVRKRTEGIEQLRQRYLAEAGDSADVRDWVACLLRPLADYLESLGRPTWFGRFSAQIITDPVLRRIMIEESLNSPALARALEGLSRCLPDLPPEVRVERSDMARHLMVHMVADQERALADGTPMPRATWRDAATGLVDAITGLWLAPATRSD